MDNSKSSAMIALLPITTEWCKIEIPHMTLVYAGEIEDLKPTTFNELAKDAASLAMISRPLHLRISGVEIFGGQDEDPVEVFRLIPTSELMALRRMVEDWNASEHPFIPHCTIGPIGSYSSKPYTEEDPKMLAFDRIMVGWGDDQLIFFMNR